MSLGFFFLSQKKKKKAKRAHIFAYLVQGKKALRGHSATTKAKSETLDSEHFQKDVLDFQTYHRKNVTKKNEIS